MSFPLIPLSYRTLYAELAQRALDGSFASDFSLDGRFIRQESRGRYYWYFDRTDETGKKRRSYVGPVDDPEISKRVETFKDLKADIRSRRKLVSTLVREAYLPRPDPKSGEVIEVLERAGFFRLRGVLVGTVAYQCYSALLGVRLPDTAMQTADADFAQFHAIATHVDDTTSPILESLQRIDKSFREMPHQADGRLVTQLASRDGYRVDFLTPNDSSADYEGRPAIMPALGSVAAEPLRFLDFLIHQPDRAVVLHGAGVPVQVPEAPRYAVHKLIVATRRLKDKNGISKSAKDQAQALTLMQAMVATHQSDALADAFMEAWDRGQHWQDAIRQSLRAISPETYGPIREALRASVKHFESDPDRYEL